MPDQRWQVTIVDRDSEDVEAELITQYEARVTAGSRGKAKERALALVREKVTGINAHNLDGKTVREISKLRGRPSN